MAGTTWNPSDKSAAITLTGGNLIATSSNNIGGFVRAIDRKATGKFYWEYTYNTVSGTEGAGISNGTVSLTSGFTAGTPSGSCGLVTTSGQIYVDGVGQPSPFGAISNGTVVCIALDCGLRQIWFRLGAAGNWNNNAANNPATPVGGVALPSLGAQAIYPNAYLNTTSHQITANFGDTAFTGAVPSGFTSGFPTGSPALFAAATQVAAEQWINANADARMTSIFLEHWGPAGTSQPQAVATLVALEQWMTVGAPVTAQARAWILA